MVQSTVQLVDRMGAEGIAHFRPVERDAHGALVDMPVIGDVGEVLEPGDGPPQLRVEGHGLELSGRLIRISVVRVRVVRHTHYLTV